MQDYFVVSSPELKLNKKFAMWDNVNRIHGNRKNWKGIRTKVLSLPRKTFPKCVCFKHC